MSRVHIVDGPAHRKATLGIGLALVAVALTLLSIGANSPYTHANLAPGFDDRYDRTDQIVVGPPGDLTRGAAIPVAGDAARRGETLYVTAGCVACHALEGRGGVIGKEIAGADPALVAQKVRGGTSGMPKFSGAVLTDAQVADISAYLRSRAAAR